MRKLQDEISSCKSTLVMVHSELASLRSVHGATAPRAEPSGVPVSYARAVAGGDQGSLNAREVRKKPPNPYTRENQQKRRFNLVIFGVDECSKTLHALLEYLKMRPLLLSTSKSWSLLFCRSPFATASG